MMIIRNFLGAFLFLLCHGGVAKDMQNLEVLRMQILEFSEDYFFEKYASMHAPEDILVSVGKIDKRLKLSNCDEFLTYEMREPPYSNGSATVKIQCMQSKPWSIYVPVKSEIYGEILIVDKSLGRGHVLVEDDLHKQKVNITALKRGYVQSMTQVIGMELKRPFSRGAVINLSHLKKPNIVTKGQEVVVESRSALLRVESSAIALNSGYEGQQIKVKNTRSNRIVAGTVVAPGRVSVSKNY